MRKAVSPTASMSALASAGTQGHSIAVVSARSMYTVLRDHSSVPYIVPGERIEPRPVTGGPGHLNYAITRLCDAYICARGGTSYTLLNEVIGVLECAKLELYRRVAAPYEDEKRRANGDVYASAIWPVAPSPPVTL